MPVYILGATAIYDMCFQGTNSRGWFMKCKPKEIAFSVIAISAARAALVHNAKSNADAKQRELTLSGILKSAEANGATVLPFTQGHAEEWETWRDHAPLEVAVKNQYHPVPQDFRMVIATAFAEVLHLVEPDERYHAELRKYGLRVTSL
jgi:hypothetical protein